MTVAGSLQLSHELGLCGNQGYHRRKHHKGMRSRGGGLRSPRLNFLFHDSLLRLDSWSLNRSGDICKPLHHVHHRITSFRCQSFLGPHQASKLSHLKAAGTTFIRSCNALQGSPQVLKVVSAVGIIVFALWGLGQLMRNSRNLFIPKGESSWKKSSTYYIMTSYLQPLLLWGGAILICRALDPVVLPTEASQMVKQRLLNFLRSLSTVLAFAYCLTSVIQQAQNFFAETSEGSDTRNMSFQFAGKALYSAVWVAAVSLFMELLGFSTQRWLTAGGLGTVLLTLAGREIFTNFLSSVMIHATRPFVVNEWIQTKIQGYDVSGTVEHVGWWSPTVIRGDDREAVHIPNHKFTVTVVRNLSQKTHWRIKTHIAISHLDVNKINNIVADMRKVIAKNPHVEQQRLHRRVFLDNIHPENQALLILISCFVKTSRFEEYLGVKEAILLDLLRVISHHRARLATPIRTVQKIYGDVDLEDVPFADSSFSGGGVSSHRPLLLIEPPYRINGEDKSKIRSGRTTEQDNKTTAKAATETKIDGKVEATPTSDSKVGDALASEIKPNGKSKGAQLTEEEELYTAASDSGMTAGEKSRMESSVKAVPEIINKDLETMSSDSKVPSLSNDSSAQKISEKKQPTKTSSVNNLQGQKSVNSSASSSETGSNKAGISQTTFQSKQASERLANGQTTPSRSTLEDNIVLGVALEGSKRTLPIEEDMDLQPRSAETKEFPANGNNHSTPNEDMDQKDGKTTPVPQNSGDK